MRVRGTLFLVVLGFSVNCNAQEHSNRNTVVKTVDRTFLLGCETGNGACSDVFIYRSSPKDSVLLVFPSGGTQSDVYLSCPGDKSVSLHDRKFGSEEKPSLDLSRLSDGRYVARMMSCNLGGGFTVVLKTGKPLD